MYSMLIVSAIGIVLAILGIGLAVKYTKSAMLFISLFGIIMFLFGSSITFVPTGYVGVATRYGQISDKVISPGFNWHIPLLEKIHTINCKQQEKNYGDMRVWSETSERTEVYCENIVVDYQINSEFAAWIWQNVEEWDHNLIKSTSIESGIKAATKQYNDADVTDRSLIEKTAKECVQNSLNTKYNNQIVDVVSVTIGNINFSDAYNEAIEKKAQAKLAAETAEYANKQKTQQIRAEAEQKKISAEADAEAKRIRASGEAEVITIKAQAQADANKLIAESLTPELIESLKIDKWNGTLPVVSGSGQSIIDLSNMVGNNEVDDNG